MAKCPACLAVFTVAEFGELAGHFVDQAARSDPAHVRFLNQQVGRRRVGKVEVEEGLRHLFDLRGGSLPAWIHRQFIAKFFGARPHPFVLALQHPTRAVLLGYTLEHQHFLRQWARSCSYILARTDALEVVRYELENLETEIGSGRPGPIPHYELLLRMGESLGYPRERILASKPLPATSLSIEGWDRICRQEPWVEAMAAMHSLELIAHRDLRKEGASLPYFDPAILKSEVVSPAARAFLREGYEADVEHSDQALSLVDRFARSPGAIEGVQGTFLRSIDLFDDYLIARLERADQIEAGH